MDNSWIENLKSISLQAVESGRPCDVCLGSVVGAAPLMVKIDQKTTLNAPQLLVPQSMTDHATQMDIPGIGEVSVTIKGGLKAGEQVIMIQKKGAQQYLIVDRY